jgi:hypothetical protein
MILGYLFFFFAGISSAVALLGGFWQSLFSLL